MMKTKTLVLLAGMFALALTATAGPRAAQASGFADYRAGMAGLITDIGAWSADLNTFVAALATKPELACSAEYADLLQRGSSLTADLAGTGRNAPRALSASQNHAVAGMTETVEGAKLIGSACNGSTLRAGLAQIQQGQAEFAKGTLRIQGFIHGFGRPN